MCLYHVFLGLAPQTNHSDAVWDSKKAINSMFPCSTLKKEESSNLWAHKTLSNVFNPKTWHSGDGGVVGG